MAKISVNGDRPGPSRSSAGKGRPAGALIIAALAIMASTGIYMSLQIGTALMSPGSTGDILQSQASVSRNAGQAGVLGAFGPLHQAEGSLTLIDGDGDDGDILRLDREPEEEEQEEQEEEEQQPQQEEDAVTKAAMPRAKTSDLRQKKANDLLPEGASWCGTAKLSQPRSNIVGVTVGKSLAIFAGGLTKGEVPTGRVDIYNAKSRKWSQASLSQPRSGPAAVALRGVAYFAGGMGRKGESSAIDIYDSATSKWSKAQLSMPRKFLAACSIDTGSQAVVIFAGGTQKLRTGRNEKSARVDIYDAIRKKWSKAHLGEGRTKLGCAGVGTKIIVVGGYGNNGYSKRADVLDVTTMKWKSAHLAKPRQFVVGATVGPLAFFGGGQWCNIGSCNGGWIREATMDVYNSETGKWSQAQKMMEARSNAAAASTPDGTWAAFAGGNSNVDPTKYFTDSACRCNCVPQEKFFPAIPKDIPRGGYQINYPKVPARNCKKRRSSYPEFTKSSSLDLYDGKRAQWTAARLPMARALNAAAGVLGKSGPQFMFAGGEIRTMHQLPSIAGGRDYYSDRVDFLCLPP